jgi:O-antigen/teichoic acid export membrane protein
MIAPATRATSDRDVSTESPTAQRRSLGAYLLEATVTNWVASLLTVVYALFITPIVIKALNKDLYGVWSFLNGLLAYSSLLYVGLGAAFIKYLSQYRAVGDRVSVNRLAAVVLFIYGVIGAACLVLCLALASRVPALLARPLAPDDADQTVTAFMLLGSRLLCMFLATVFSGVLLAEEKIAIAARVTIVATIARFIAVPLLIGHGSPLITLAIIMSVSAAAEAVALTVLALRFVPSLRMVPSLPTRAELRLLYGFGVKSFFIDLSAWLINYTDVILIGLLIGASGVAVYSIPLQLVTYGRVLVQGMMSALLPRLSAYEATGDRPALASAYIRVSRVTNFVAAFVAFNLLTIGVPFLRLWVGPEFASAGSAILTILTVAGYCQVLSTQTSVPFYQAMHRLRAPVTVLLVEAGANLGLSIWLAGRIGVTGVAVATLVPAALITFVVLPADLSARLRIPVSRLLTKAVWPSACLLAAGVLANLLVDRVLVVSSYAAFAARGCVNVALAAAIAYAVLPEEDLTAVAQMARAVRARASRRALSRELPR